MNDGRSTDKKRGGGGGGREGGRRHALICFKRTRLSGNGLVGYANLCRGASHVIFDIDTRVRSNQSTIKHLKDSEDADEQMSVAGECQRRETQEGMAVSSDVVEKIRRFSEDCRKREEEHHVADSPSDEDWDEHNRQLERTLSALQEQVKRQDEALRELRLSRQLDLPHPDLDPISRLAQTRRATAAYKALSELEPELPPADSALPGLIALREIGHLTRELQTSISATAQDLNSDRERSRTEEINLRDAKVIASGLKARIEGLKAEQSNAKAKDKEKASGQKKIARETMQDLRKRNEAMEKETTEMWDALRNFIDEHLAAMLAAEDLGGPAVGDQIDVSDVVLEAGYTAHGKERKPRSGAEDGVDGRQRRIDGYLEGEGNRPPRNRRQAAAAETHGLIEQLLQAASTSSSYVELDRDSPASRFLVKAKIAQYHPRDSRRLRLIDAAREISD